ncbi:LytR/AlgR family response regulator transcription factor [Terrimonas rubra]|uniref:LytR/AlgR family response regulator transcription factor n=1 Tax=Terrimonas rubra TaxID=1035890 RepID=A0ABW6A6C9_9BACT
MRKINCLIVEDEPLAAEIIQGYITEIPSLHLAGIATDAIYAMEMLQREKIDVIFLDIHLPKIKGLDFIKTLNHPPKVILTTAYREYALDGYELNVVDYLLKPVSFNRFMQAVNKLTHLYVEVGAKEETQPAKTYIFVNINKKKVKIEFNKIIYVESRKEYVYIVTREQNYLIKMSLNELELQLGNEFFLRIHRSFIVSKQMVTAYNATEIEIQGQLLPIGRNYKEIVAKRMGEALH